MPETRVSVAAPPPDAVGVSPRERLRRTLVDRVGCTDDLVYYLDQAAANFPGDAGVRLAVEELVDFLSRFIAFDPIRDDDLGASVWTSATGARLVVVVDEATAARVRISQMARLRDHVLGTIAVDDASQVSALCVLCGEDPRGTVEEAIAVRRAGDHVRLVTLSGLVTLARLVETGQVTHLAALQILRPARALADPLISLLGRLRPSV